MWEEWQYTLPFSELLLIPAAVVSVIIYASLLCVPELGKWPRMLALAVNFSAAAILVRYAFLAPIAGSPAYEHFPAMYHIFLVGLPLSIIFASFLGIAKRRWSRVIAAIVSLIAWALFVFIAVVPVYAPDYWDHKIRQNTWSAFACFACPFIFIFAAVVVSYFPRVGSIMGALAGLLAMPWFASTEFEWFQMGNSWIALNVSEADKFTVNSILLAKLRIFTVALIVTATALSLLRLVPAHWTLRKRPICERTWPAFAVCFVVLAVWFGCAVVPYRLPGMVDHSIGPDVRILHVEKRGLQFHETTISVYRVRNGTACCPCAPRFQMGSRLPEIMHRPKTTTDMVDFVHRGLSPCPDFSITYAGLELANQLPVRGLVALPKKMG